MIPIYREEHYTFRFGEARVIGRFHLEGQVPGRRVTVYWFNSQLEKVLEEFAQAVVGPGGWVELAQEIHVDARRGFVVVPRDEVV